MRKEAMDLRESKEGHVGGLGGKKGKGEKCSYNLRNKN